MARKTKVLGFSVPPEVAEEYEALAARQGTTKSELFRQMIDVYREQIQEAEFFRLQRKMADRARRPRTWTEKDVERIVFEDR